MRTFKRKPSASALKAARDAQAPTTDDTKARILAALRAKLGTDEGDDKQPSTAADSSGQGDANGA